MSNENSVMSSIKFDSRFFLGWWKLLFAAAGEILESFFDWLFMLTFLIYGMTIFNLLNPKKEELEPEEIRNVPVYTTKVCVVWVLLIILAILLALIFWMGLSIWDMHLKK
jgi:hypothetical protein